MPSPLKQVPLNEWRYDSAEIALCTLPIKQEAFAAQTGLVFSRVQDELGGEDVAVATIEGNTVLFHARPKDSSSPEQLQFVSVTARGDVQNPAALLGHVLQIASISPAQLLWCQPDLKPREWALYRLDDNNNRFLMSYFHDREIAERQALYYESLGHKQTYYVERAL